VYEHDPQLNWRNNLRVRFIKGIYQLRRVLESLFEISERTQVPSHSYIDRILEKHLRVLKDLSHILYRVTDRGDISCKHQRLFDKFLGELWHELDKARGNARLLEFYASEDEINDNNHLRGLRQLDRQVLAAARRDMPVQIRRARKLMDRLIPLFERILPLYRSNEVVIRTIYFSQDFFDRVLDRPSTVYFFDIIFPGKVGEGYNFLCESLEQSRHFDQAREACEEAIRILSSQPRKSPYLDKFHQRLETLKEKQASLSEFPSVSAAG